MTPEKADNAQQWKGMDGATAYHLIDRHAEGWGDVGEMMNAWLRANTTLKQAQDPVAWFEAEESARGANPREIMWGMAHSTRMSKEKPNTTNPVWALYAAPKPGKPA